MLSPSHGLVRYRNTIISSFAAASFITKFKPCHFHFYKTKKHMEIEITANYLNLEVQSFTTKSELKQIPLIPVYRSTRNAPVSQEALIYHLSFLSC